MRLATGCRSREHPRPHSSNRSKTGVNPPSRKASLHNEIVIAGGSKVGPQLARAMKSTRLILPVLRSWPSQSTVGVLVLDKRSKQLPMFVDIAPLNSTPLPGRIAGQFRWLRYLILQSWDVSFRMATAT